MGGDPTEVHRLQDEIVKVRKQLAAHERAPSSYDPARMLTWFSAGTLGLLTLALCVWISWQFFNGDAVATELWAALTGIIGWITAKLGGVFDNRFGTTRQSADKDVTIQRLLKPRKSP